MTVKKYRSSKSKVEMAFLEVVKNRYTTKSYDPAEKVSEEVIGQLKEILRLSPSSINSQPWNFTFISDQEVKERFADVSYFNAQKIKDASHLVVFSVIDDVNQFEQQITKNLPEGSVNYYHRFVKPKGEREIKSWLQCQVYLSLGFFLAACANLGIDSTPMEGIENDKYDQLLGIQGYKTLVAVAIGYRNPHDTNQPNVKPKSRLAIEDVIQSITG